MDYIKAYTKFNKRVDTFITESGYNPKDRFGIDIHENENKIHIFVEEKYDTNCITVLIDEFNDTKNGVANFHLRLKKESEEREKRRKEIQEKREKEAKENRFKLYQELKKEFENQ